MYSLISKELAAEIGEKRKMMNMTRETFAIKVGISIPYVQKIEACKVNRVNSSIVDKILRVLKIVDDLPEINNSGDDIIGLMNESEFEKAHKIASIKGKENLAWLIKMHSRFNNSNLKDRKHVLSAHLDELNEYYVNTKHKITSREELNIYYMYVIALAIEGYKDDAIELSKNLILALDSDWFTDTTKTALTGNIANLYFTIGDMDNAEIWNEKMLIRIRKSRNIMLVQNYYVHRISLKKIRGIDYSTDLIFIKQYCSIFGIKMSKSFENYDIAIISQV